MPLRLLTTLCCLLLAPAALAAEEVSLELILPADRTGSTDNTKIAFQRQAYAKAITHPDALDTITFSGLNKLSMRPNRTRPSNLK